MNKLAIITGASSGIGREIAKTLSEKGHPVLLLSRRLKEMEELNLPNSLCKSVDVTDLNTMEKAIKEAEEKFGKADLLVNCAGIMLLGDPASQSYTEWSNMIDVNIKGILTGTNILLESFKERKEGTIINISSIAGRKTFDNHSVYCGTKFAVHAISENIRKEVASSNVRVITIAPGVVETPLLSHTTDAAIKANYNDWKKTIESGLDAKKIAQCVDFAYSQPQDVCIREIVISKTKQED